MTRRHELEGVVRSWLREDGHEDADRVLFSVLGELDTTPQRHASWLARRLPFMNSNTFRFGIAAAAVVAGAALVGANLLPDSIGDPDPTSPPSPSARPLVGATVLEPGPYIIDTGFPLRISFSVPSEGWVNYVWESGAAAGNTRAVCFGSATCDPPAAAGVGFHIVTGVPTEPCNPGAGRMDIGATIDDLADAIRDRPGWRSTSPVQTAVGGYPALAFEIRAQPQDVDGCPGSVSAFFAGSFGRAATAGERLRLWVVDVGGDTRLVIEAFDFGSTPNQDVDAATRIVDSVELQLPADLGAGGAAEREPVKPGRRRSVES